MSPRKRKSREERILEIMTAARSVFIEKSYASATMEDIIEKTDLSKGGFYHYYSDKNDILIDMMRMGNVNYMRSNPFMHKIDESTSIEEKVDILLEAFTDKCLAITDDKKIFAMFLFEAMFDQKVWLAYKALEENFVTYLYQKLNLEKPSSTGEAFFLSRLQNVLLLGQQCSKEPELMLEHKETIKEC